MILRRTTLALSLVLAALCGATGAHAQFLDAGDAPAGDAGGEEELESDEGLQSATPTDNVNELNTAGGNPANAGAVEGGDGDFPAQNAPAEFDIENTGDEGGNDFFTNGQPANLGPQQAAPSAFGDGAEDKAGANAATAPPAAGKPAQFVEPVPTQTAPANPVVNQATTTNPAAPANAAPANAAALMNQIANPAAPADPNATTDATGAEPLTQAPAEPPPIEAPPLPPPNEFSGAPPVPGTMRLMAEGEAPEEYNVLPGDTLFDICDQLLDEPGYWPKLWALNPEIKNPHFIFPNMKLRFYPGDDETPPYLQVVTEDDVIPIDKGDLDEQELIAEKVIFPENVVEEYVTEVIGPSQVDPLEEEIMVGGRRYDGADVQLTVPGFIFKNEKEPLGFVISGRNGEVSLQTGQQVLVESISGISAGTGYTVLRPGAEVEDPETGDLVGYKYDYIGDVQITKSLGEEVWVGRVASTLLTVRPDDILVPAISVARSIPSEESLGSLSSVDANVVGFGFARQDIGGRGSYVFIDKGNGDGVSPGMYLPIFGTPGYMTLSMSPSGLPEDYQQVGVMRIIDATDGGACGYIVRNTTEIRIGDRTGKD